jgi:alanine racemase
MSAFALRATADKSAFALGGTAAASFQFDAVDRLHGSFDPWVEVQAANLRSNAAAVHARVKRPILAVIKNNGYGAGVWNVARVLEPLDAIAGFAVVKLHEAHALRDAGIRKPILLMGPLDATEVTDAARQRIVLMVYTPIASALERAAAAIGRPVDVHVCVDTGLGRVGVPYAQAPDLIQSLARSKGVRIAGTSIHHARRAAESHRRAHRNAPRRLVLHAVPASRCHARHGAARHGALRDLPGNEVPHGGRARPEAGDRTQGARRLRQATPAG